jgi:tRNA uridine 5-carbamoylmethylation protein Kti12
MSRFVEFLKNNLREDAEAVPAFSDNATFGNAGNKTSTLSNHVKTSEETEEKKINDFIKKNNIRLDKGSVETIIALINKTLKDFNREKQIDEDEIKEIISFAIDDGLVL